MTVFDLDTPHLNSGSRSEFSGATKPNSSWSQTQLTRPIVALVEAGPGLVIEGDDALGRACQIGDDEADARVQLARMPFDLGHDVAPLVPALRLIAEAGKIAAHLVRRSPNRALDQVTD